MKLALINISISTSHLKPLKKSVQENIELRKRKRRFNYGHFKPSPNEQALTKTTYQKYPTYKDSGVDWLGNS